jgi:tyrosyl-tRNA synthetase
MHKWEQLTQEQRREVECQMELLTRGTAEVVPVDDFKLKIINSVAAGKPLKIKLGLDPSAPDIHVGHTVVLQKLRQFQQFGHQVQLLIGDFTGRIGDPTGKSETRKQLTEEDVIRNAETYKKQIYKILDPQKTVILYNSEWLSKMNFADVISLASTQTVARMLERDDFSKRYSNGLPIHIHEFFYPLMQGYDSVALECDVELGGTDQKFNLLMGRTLQKEYNQLAQVAMMMPLLEGLDGIQKMSKSLGNYIGIDEEPNEIYGKAMSVPDELMIKYYELATDISNEDLAALKTGIADGTVHPRDAKMRLAKTFVRMYHSNAAADEAEQRFITVYQQRSLPDEIDEVELSRGVLEKGSIRIVELLVGLGMQSSNGEAKRSIQGGAVRINEQKVVDPNATVVLEGGEIIQVGKRKFVKIKLVE